MRPDPIYALILAALCGLWVLPASAQLHRATDPVLTPASALLVHDDALAIDVNPAALGQLEGWSVAYVHSEVDATGTWLGRGDAVYLGIPIFDGFTFATSIQSVRPDPDPSVAGRFWVQDADRSSVAMSFAIGGTRRFGIAMTTRTFMSPDPRFDGLSVVDLGMLFRPSGVYELGIVGRDLLATRFGGGTGGLGLAPSLLITGSLRPLGTSVLSLDAAVVLGDDPLILGGRAGASLLIPNVGRLTGLVEVDRLGDGDQVTRAMAELGVTWGGLSIAGGAIGDPSARDRDGIVGDYVAVRLHQRMRPGIPAPGYILDLQLSGLGPRRMLAISLLLDRALRDDRIAGVLLRPRNANIGRAYAQELRMHVAALRAAGKQVVCHFETASGNELYACAGADVLLIDPVGSIRLLGTGTTVVLYGDTVRKLGVRADFLRIGHYKGAAEQLTHSRMGESARQQMLQLLDDAHARFVVDLSRDLGLDTEKVAALMDHGMHMAPQLLDNGLVAAAVDTYELSHDSGTYFGGRALHSRMPSRQSPRWGVPARVGVVMIDGVIVDGENVDVPFFGTHMSGGHTIARTLDAMVSDPSIASIVVRVDSPGGAVVASDQIWRAIRRAAKHKPVVASMGSMAASGGYYAACAADEIWADPSTMTGSIGIFAGKVDVVELAEKLGIGIEHFSRGKRHGADSIYRPFTPDERAALAEVLRVYYRKFVERVAEGRNMTFEQVDALARGRVYTGDRAQQLGLVDKLGGFSSALARARQLGGLSRDAEVVVRPSRPDGLLDYVLGNSSSRASAAEIAAKLEFDPSGGRIELPRELQSLARFVTMGLLTTGGSQGTPLALMPYEINL